jgi:hypothetical protein
MPHRFGRQCHDDVKKPDAAATRPFESLEGSELLFRPKDYPRFFFKCEPVGALGWAFNMSSPN